MRRTAAVAAAALALLLGACSDTDEQDTRPPPSGDRTGEERTDRERRGEASVTATPPAPGATGPSAPPLTDRFVPADGADELARRLTSAEDLVRDRRTRGELLAAAAFETQLLYRQLARQPGWERQARAAVPARYRADVQDHVTARRSLRSVLTSLSDQLPAWEVVEPAPVGELMRYYREGERVHGVEWELLAAINLVETGFGKIDGLSSAGAQGPMQFIPSTWAAYGEGDVDDAHDAILGAANYLAASGAASGDVEGALYAYNNHAGYVAGISAYARILRRDPAALRGLHQWQIVYLSTIGDIWLPVGYRHSDPVPVRAYVRRHPDRHLGTATD